MALRHLGPMCARLRGVGSTAVRRLVGSTPKGEAGQGMVEYALVLLFIAIVVIAIISILGHQVSNVFSNVSSAFH